MNPAVCGAFALAIIADGEGPAYPGIPNHEPDVAKGRKAADTVHRCMNELRAVASSGGAYVSESNFFESDFEHSYWGANHARLAEIKKKYDPDGLRYAAAGIEETGLGLSDFGVLEVLLNKGSLPVNTIGPIVDLTPGSISIAVDRLFAKGLVTRVESTEDRRVRIIALTPRGKDLIVPAFKKHSGQMKRVLSELRAEELRSLEVALKKLGKRAAALMEES
jgi:MarR family transcriptional regulator, 2-MHQ and catechol-resistance regulon repressor